MQYEKVVFCGLWFRMGGRNLVIVADIMYASRNAGIYVLIVKFRVNLKDAEQVCSISKGFVSHVFLFIFRFWMV